MSTGPTANTTVTAKRTPWTTITGMGRTALSRRPQKPTFQTRIRDGMHCHTDTAARESAVPSPT